MQSTYARLGLLQGQQQVGLLGVGVQLAGEVGEGIVATQPAGRKQ